MKNIVMQEVRNAIQEADKEESASVINGSIIQQNMDDVLGLGHSKYPQIEDEKLFISFV
jgi:hypothetical protein